MLVRLQLGTPFQNVLRPQAEQQITALKVRPVTPGAALRHRKCNVVIQPNVQPARPLLEFAGHEIHRRRADESGDKLRLRRVVEIVRRADLLYQAVIHHHHPIGKCHGLDLIVGDIDRGSADFLMHPLDFDAHLHPQLGIEVGKRFIEQKHFGIAHDGAAHRHALALSAGELLWLAFEKRADVEDPGGVLDPDPDLVFRDLFEAQAERHVLEHRHVRVQGVILKHHGDVAILRRHVIHYGAAHQDFAGADVLQACDHAQRRALAAARRPHQNDELLVQDFQIDPPHGGGVVIVLGHLAQRYLGHRSVSMVCSRGKVACAPSPWWRRR